MKKALLSTTALIAASAIVAVAASPASAENEKISLRLGGFMEQWIGYSSQDDVLGTDTSGPIQASDTEVFFLGKTTLDNGISFGVNIQLEGNTTGDTIDESYLTIGGDFGLVYIGDENSAQYKMQYSAPDVGIGANSGDQTIWASFAGVGGTAGTFRGPFGSTFVEAARANDVFRLSYFTPRFSGFQFGASYAPTATQDTSGPIDRDADLHDGISLGANFVESFNGVDVAVAAGYGMWQSGSTAAVAETAANTLLRSQLSGAGLDANGVNALAPSDAVAASNPDDPEAWNLGLSIGFSGFTVGGSYAEAKDDPSVGDMEGWDIGVSYATGPWGVGVIYYHGERDGGGTALKAEIDTVMGSAAYTMGPGIKIIGTLGYTEISDESGTGEDNEAVYFVVGPKLSF